MSQFITKKSKVPPDMQTSLYALLRRGFQIEKDYRGVFIATLYHYDDAYERYASKDLNHILEMSK